METQPQTTNAANAASIHCCKTMNAVIPGRLIGLEITSDFLKEKSACEPGYKWFRKKFGKSCQYVDLRIALAAENHKDWESWIQTHVGGDVATAGDSGTATAGDSGTATAGYSGTATAGDSGTATAGDRGTATAGYSGTATAGYSGTATAGEDGVISILYWDGKKYRRKIGQIGDGIKKGVPYRLNDRHEFEEVKGGK